MHLRRDDDIDTGNMVLMSSTCWLDVQLPVLLRHHGDHCGAVRITLNTMCFHTSNYACLLLLLLLGTTRSLVKANRLQRIILDRNIFQNKYTSPVLQDLSQIKEQRGIVFPCGGGKMLANAYVAVRVVRDYLACHLPIEIAYYGEHEIDAHHKSLFEVRSATW